MGRDSSNGAFAGGAGRRPLRVCYLIDRLAGQGGTEKHLLELIAHLDRRRVAPSLALLRGQRESLRHLEPGCCPVIRLNVARLHQPSTLVEAWRFGRFLRKQRIDVVQTYFADSTYFGTLVARLAGVRLVLRTRRSLGYWMTPLHRVAERLSSRLVTVTVVNSHACWSELRQRERIAAASIVTIPNGIAAAPLASVPPPAPLANGRSWRVGVLANLRPIKDLPTFIRAAHQLAPKLGAQFIIAGEGELQAQLQQLINDLGLRQHVRLVGAATNVPQLLERLDVAVLCSRSESLSNALIEYMLAARPIVATAVGGNVELIEHERQGLLVPPGQPRALASAIERLLRDRPLAARLAAEARRRALGCHDQRSHANRFADLYERLLGCQRVAPH